MAKPVAVAIAAPVQGMGDRYLMLALTRREVWFRFKDAQLELRAIDQTMRDIEQKAREAQDDRR